MQGKKARRNCSPSIERGMPATFPCLIDIHQANNHRDEHNKPLALCAPTPLRAYVWTHGYDLEK